MYFFTFFLLVPFLHRGRPHISIFHWSSSYAPCNNTSLYRSTVSGTVIPHPTQRRVKCVGASARDGGRGNRVMREIMVDQGHSDSGHGRGWI